MNNLIQSFTVLCQDSTTEQLHDLLKRFNNYPQPMHPEDQKIKRMIEDEIEIREFEKSTVC